MVIFILLLIVISNMFVRYLAIVSGGNIEANAIFKMISVMLPKYIAYLLPISFFFAILLVYGKLFSNNDWTDVISLLFLEIMDAAVFELTVDYNDYLFFIEYF